MYLSIIFLPLIGAIIAGLFGRFVGQKGAQLITVCCVALSSIFSFIAFYEVGLLKNTCYITLAPWIDIGMVNASWGFLFDSLTCVMLIVVTVVSTMVHIYSCGYMEYDPHVPRFMSYLSLFTTFMLLLITADNFVQMFLGWEGVGLCSFLLINFWFTRLQANKAAIKAMIVNRIGDFGLSLGIILIYIKFKALDYATVFTLIPYYINDTIIFLNYEINTLTLIGLLLFVGAVGKSAQLGLHTWLPDAMEGPTPVSALIHAATMVTAGVFLIARCSPLYEYTPTALFIITFFGAMTAFFAATIGLVQNDLKRVIAYSTCSQLGYMVFACGMSNYSVGIFHLANHAFFKALLFLSAGSVIHAMSDEQDMRKMGGLAQLIPFTYSMMVIGSLSLMGFPFLTGFYSKDVIIELSYATYTIDGHFTHWLGCIAASFTAFYSFRLIYLTFLSKTNGLKKIIEHAHDAPNIMAYPLMVLAFGSIFIGFLTKDLMIGVGTNFWNNSLFTLPAHSRIFESEFIDTSIKLIPVILSLFGSILAVVLNKFYPTLLLKIKINSFFKKIYFFFSKRWYFDKISNDIIVKGLMQFGYTTTFKILDRGIIEMFGPYGLMITLTNISKKISLFQTGNIYHSGLNIILGLLIILLFIIISYFTMIPNFYLDLNISEIIIIIIITCMTLLLNKQ